jgi:two-component system CheB/CheR fusion protein
MSTILVVDDQPANRHFLATLLGYFDHVVVEAGDGVEALENFRRGDVDLVITDVLMPTLDGYDFVRKLRADECGRETPVIFYTAARYEPAARAMAETHGVRHFLTKPAEPEQILAAVNSALGQSTRAISASSLTKFNRHVLKAPADAITWDAVVFVVDDDPVVRQSLLGIIGGASLKVESFSTAEAFLDGFDPKRTSCLLLDICLPGMSGIALLELLRSRRSQIPTIILTGHGNIVAAVDAFRLRVADFLEKPVDARILMAKVYRALQEDSIRRRELSAIQAVRKRMSRLTPREIGIVKLLVLGESSKEIAAEYHISVKTVSNHRTRVMAKTGASNVADLVRMSMIAVDA